MPAQAPDLDCFLARYRASLVVLSGRATGLEYELDQGAVRLGRGPGVDLAIDDPSMEREHAVLEFHTGAFWLCSVAREAPTLLNGGAITRQELKHQDHFRLGGVRFGYALESRRRR